MISDTPPDFKLPFPRHILDKQKVKLIFQKIFEVMRWELYLRIKKVTRDRSKQEDEYYVTKNEMKNIMNSLDLWQIRAEVFKLYQVPVPQPLLDPPHEILMRAHYTYMADDNFDQQIRKLKQDHEKYIAILLENIDFVKDMEDMYTEERIETTRENWKTEIKLTNNT